MYQRNYQHNFHCNGSTKYMYSVDATRSQKFLVFLTFFQGTFLPINMPLAHITPEFLLSCHVL